MGNYAYVDATIDFKTTDEKVYEETRALFNEHFPDENGNDYSCDYEIRGKTIRVICSACSGYDEDDDDNTIDFIDSLKREVETPGGRNSFPRLIRPIPSGAPSGAFACLHKYTNSLPNDCEYYYRTIACYYAAFIVICQCRKGKSKRRSRIQWKAKLQKKSTRR